MKFHDRLKQYRESLEMSSYDFSQKLDLSKSYYSLIESGKREPSKNVLYSLIALSKKPEEYWLYGIEKEDELIRVREDFKALKQVLNAWEMVNGEYLKEKDFIKLFDDIKDLSSIEDLLLKALKTDLKHFYNKNKML